jgi:hypothetical protein
VLEVDVPPPLGVTPGDGEQLALAQRLARAYVDQDQEPFQELVGNGISLIAFLRQTLVPSTVVSRMIHNCRGTNVVAKKGT